MGFRFLLPPVRCAMLSFLGAVALVACTNALAPYRGPQPDAVPLVNEAVVIRVVEAPLLGQYSYIVDRERFVAAGDPHNVNRIVWIFAKEGDLEGVPGPALQPGARVVVTTEYVGARSVGALPEIPDWPGHGYYLYPVGWHRIVSLQSGP
jgi:hypothetical protein